jgi:hypothetical protein
LRERGKRLNLREARRPVWKDPRGFLVNSVNNTTVEFESLNRSLDIPRSRPAREG